MPRGKTNLAFIENDAERRASYNKRKGGLMKKASELSTLCDVETCAVIYGPYEQEPVVWPSHAGALATIDRFNQVPEMDRTRKMFDQEEFTRQRITKLREKVNRLRQENKIKEMENFMYKCIAGQESIQNLNFEDVGPIRHVVGQTMRTIESGIGNASASTMVGPPAFASGSSAPPENFAESPFPPSEENMQNFPWADMQNLSWADVQNFPASGANEQ